MTTEVTIRECDAWVDRSEWGVSFFDTSGSVSVYRRTTNRKTKFLDIVFFKNRFERRLVMSDLHRKFGSLNDMKDHFFVVALDEIPMS